MAIKPGLQLKLGQHLALTPQLQQSIRLLQLSSLELAQEIEQALSDNPLLECDDPPVGAAMRIAADGAILSEMPAVAAPPAGGAEQDSGQGDRRDRSDIGPGVGSHPRRARRGRRRAGSLGRHTAVPVRAPEGPAGGHHRDLPRSRAGADAD